MIRIALAKKIEEISKINLIKLQVARKAEGHVTPFQISRTWMSPRKILHTSRRKMALVNYNILVANRDRVEGDLLNGKQVLCHLHVKTRNILENNC